MVLVFCYELITDNFALGVAIDDMVFERKTRLCREECKEYIPPITY